MKTLKDKIIDKLKEYDIEINNTFQSGNDEVLIIDYSNICLRDKEVFISFCVDCPPSYAAKIILLLRDVKGIDGFDIGEEFAVDQDGKFLDGKEAYKFIEEHKKTEIINEFINQQSQLYFLNKAQSFHC